MALPLSIDDDTLPPGAELMVWRGAYWHHGIYVGRRRVIHYAGSVLRQRDARIQETSLQDFSHNRPIHAASLPAHPEQEQLIVSRARSRLGERGYSVLFNNCEHFTHWCRLGVSRSDQVEAVVQAVTVLRSIAAFLARLSKSGSGLRPLERV